MDPSRCTDTGKLALNWRALVAHMTGLWQVLANSVEGCPSPLRQLLACVHAVVSSRFGAAGVTAVSTAFGWNGWPINTIMTAEGLPLQPWTENVTSSSSW